MTKLDALKIQYAKALTRFQDVLKMSKNEIVRDSAIKRFELLFDLSWKLIKAFLEEEKGVRCTSPKGCFREAYKQELLDYDQLWITMADWRNEAVHTYSEKFAQEFYKRLPQTLERFLILRERILQKP